MRFLSHLFFEPEKKLTDFAEIAVLFFVM